jgi:hypothetical protein
MMTSNELRQSLQYAIQRHFSSVRFISAGFYSDAIQTILQGLGSLDIKGSRAQSINLQPSEDGNCSYIVDCYPINLLRSDIESREFLVITMVYNLALAYHMYAMAQNDKRAALDEALKLYKEVLHRLHLYNFTDFPLMRLENNIRHAIWIRSPPPIYLHATIPINPTIIEQH